MNAKKFMVVAGIAAVILVMAVTLVPMALAQAPVDEIVLGYGNGPMMDGGIRRGSPMRMSIFAAGPMGQQGQGQGQGSGFVDEDGDGVCDNFANGERGQGQGPGFVDENEDGVCDHFANGERGQGQGQGSGFTDEDGDGVCDHAGTGGIRGGRGAGRAGGAQGQMMGRWAQQGTW